MVNILASRVAGLRLSLIILSFLIPIAVLGFFLTSQISAERAQTEREIMGTRLFMLANPVYQGAAKGEIPPDAADNFLKNGRPLALNLGIAKQFDTLNDQLKNNPLDLKGQMATTRRLLELVESSSGIRLEPDLEANHLQSFLFRDVPAIVADLKTMQTAVVGNAMASTSTPFNNLEHIFNSAGHLQKSIANANESISGANEASPAPNEYTNIVALLYSASSRIEHVIDQFRRDANSQNPDMIRGAVAFNEQARQVFGYIKIASDQASEKLADQLNTRLEGLNRKNAYTGAVSIASILIGLGAALRMFQSTLRRLDDLETARLGAETARKDAEDMNGRLTDINNEIVTLNSELADKMRRLKDAQDELLRRGRMEQLGQLTATVAHELRNPLGAVRTSAFLLERKIKDKGLGVEAQLSRINHGITRCDSIITQLLDFSRTKQINATESDLDEWLAKIIEEEARRIPSAVSIECTLGLDARDVPFDPARLQRAIINLISNAAEAMVGTGEDPSKFTTQNPRITIQSHVENDMAVISVMDNGPGISPDIIEKIREPLFTTKSFGTGLGIPAVEQIVVQHGGSLDISSETGKGARFSLNLPLHPPKAEAA